MYLSVNTNEYKQSKQYEHNTVTESMYVLVCIIATIHAQYMPIHTQSTHVVLACIVFVLSYQYRQIQANTNPIYSRRGGFLWLIEVSYWHVLVCIWLVLCLYLLVLVCIGTLDKPQKTAPFGLLVLHVLACIGMYCACIQLVLVCIGRIFDLSIQTNTGISTNTDQYIPNTIS
jgi:hypothetical protein